MPSKDPAHRLRHIVENAERIFDHTRDMTVSVFLRDQKTIDAVERCLQRIAEAARKIGALFDDDYPELKLHALRQYGNVLRHEYDEILPAMTWGSIKEDLPPLVAMARAELAKLED